MVEDHFPGALPGMADRFAIIDGIRHGYSRMLDQFVDDFWDKHMQITDLEAAAEDHLRFVSGQKLLRRRSYELPFNAKVLDDLLRREDLRVLRGRLTYGVLASVVLKGELKRSVLEKGSADRQAARAASASRRRSARGVEDAARFLKEWGSVFSRRGSDEKGAARYSSAFQPVDRSRLADEVPTEAEFMEFAQHELEMDFVGLPAHYLPPYVRNLEEFAGEWREALQRLAREKDADAARIRFLQAPDSRVTFLQVLLHTAVIDVLSMHWIADRRRDHVKVLRSRPALRIADADARYLREAHGRLLPGSLARQALYFAGLYYKRWGCLDGALALWSEGLADTTGSEAERELLLSSIGIVHRDRSNAKLATKAFSEAVDILRRGPDKYRLGLAIKNLAEARALNGKERLSRETFNEAVELLGVLETDGRRNLSWNLALAARRCGFRDIEEKALGTFLRTDPDDTDQVIYTNQRLSELGLYSGLHEMGNPYVLDPSGSTPDERIVFIPQLSDRTLVDEKVAGPDAGFEELLDEVQPLIEKPFRIRPGAGVGFTYSQEPTDPDEYSRLVVCFDRKWVRWIESLAAKHGFSASLLLKEVAQIVTYDRMELLDELTPEGEAGAAKLDGELRRRVSAHLEAFFERFMPESPRPFYLFHILSIEDAVEDALYHFFGIRFDDGRSLAAVHGRLAAHPEPWYPVYWRAEAPGQVAGGDAPVDTR